MLQVWLVLIALCFIQVAAQEQKPQWNARPLSAWGFFILLALGCIIVSILTTFIAGGTVG